MNLRDSNNLLKFLARWVDSKGLNQFEAGVWNKLFLQKKCNYKIAYKAMEQLYIDHPPCTLYGKLPAIQAFKDIYNSFIKPQYDSPGKCPCCSSSTFISFIHEEGRHADKNVAYDCPSCWLKTGRPKRTASFESRGFSLCDNTECSNPDREETIIIPRGSYHYYQHLKKCVYCNSVTEEIANIPDKDDLPGVEEEKL